LGEETLYLIAHIGLLKLLKKTATWAPSGSDSR
jgi:hypothetical protein